MLDYLVGPVESRGCLKAGEEGQETAREITAYGELGAALLETRSHEPRSVGGP